MTLDTTFPKTDFRHIYFGPENLGPTLDRVEVLRPDVPDGMTLPELALRFILADDRVSTVIPGMRSIANVRKNTAVSDGVQLSQEILSAMRAHRWDRSPTAWSL
jgi:aryl-alcohol dehydrogenase-like predicted oxidoreductase